MIEKEVVIGNKQGLHARPASKFVQAASQFKSDIFVVKDGVCVNGKSIMGLLALAAPKGAHLIIRVDGEDERDAMDLLCKLVGSKFEED